MNIKDITFCIKTFERPLSVQRCIDSIRSFYNDAYIIVADDSTNPIRPDRCDEYFELPFDSGLSRGRNVLVENVKTKYMVMLDDDCDFTMYTNLKLMYDTIENTEYNLVGGYMGKSVWHGCFYEDDENIGLIIGAWRKRTETLIEYDFVENFFIAETDVVKKIKWADEIKIEAEHEEFFYRGKSILKCCMVRSLVGNSRVYNGELYKRMRYRQYIEMARKYYLKNKRRTVIRVKKEYEESDFKADEYTNNKPFKISDKTKFIITSCARAGSHLIQGALNSHSQLNVADELVDWLYTDTEIHDLLENSDGFINHYTDQNHNEIRYNLLKAPVKFILLRRNPLESFVSLKRAVLIDSWHNPPRLDSDVTQDPSNLSFKICPIEYRYYKRRMNEYYEEVKSKLNDYIEVQYEDVISNWDYEMKRIQEYLGVDVEILTKQTNKQITKPYNELVTNWDEMLEVDKLPLIERPDVI